MKFNYFAYILVFLGAYLCSSCQDDLSSQGSSLVNGEVTIIVDSIPMNIPSRVVTRQAYDARSATKLLGRVSVPEYGKLDCSFLTAMYPLSNLTLPDTVTAEDIDSLRLVLFVPRGSLTGDSLAAQQLKAYRLNRQLPVDITNNADPSEFYSEKDLIGSNSYTLSLLHSSDSIYKKDPYIKVPIKLPHESALELYNAYKEHPDIFEWPQNLAPHFPGIYVRQSFGNGCIGRFSQSAFFLYYKKYVQAYVKNEETDSTELKNLLKRDSLCVMVSSPEVVSTNVISYTVSEKLTDMVENGDAIITTPGGYTVDIDFPAKKIIDAYNRNSSKLTVISSLSMEIPAEKIENDYNIPAAPALLMVKTSELDDFFQNNRVPDEKTSFYAPYIVAKKSYSFSMLRDYIIGLIESGKDPEPEDLQFSLIPVDVTTESIDNYDGTTSVYVTKCTNYIKGPSMTLLHLDRAIVNFTYSKQTLE